MRTEIVPGITADPEVAFGKPVIAGTRVPAAVIIGQLAAGIIVAGEGDGFEAGVTRDSQGFFGDSAI